MSTYTRTEWIDRFAMRMGSLGVRANPEHLSEMAEELFPTMGHLNPEEAAQAEFEAWPPHDH